MLRPVETRTRDVAVLDALAEMIDQAGLKKGDRLPSEPLLAEKLGVSRPTIREALKSWQTLGIVTRLKGSGTFLATDVRDGSPSVPIALKLEGQSLLRTLEVRRALEVVATREAALKASADDRLRIRQAYDQLQREIESGIDWRPTDGVFHQAIYRASQNPLFGEIIEQVHQAFHQIYIQPFDTDVIGLSSMPIHEDLCNAVLSGDADRAVEVIETILDLVEADVRRAIGV